LWYEHYRRDAKKFQASKKGIHHTIGYINSETFMLTHSMLSNILVRVEKESRIDEIDRHVRGHGPDLETSIEGGIHG
jgi:hypothetical protein